MIATYTDSVTGNRIPTTKAEQRRYTMERRDGESGTVWLIYKDSKPFTRYAFAEGTFAENPARRKTIFNMPWIKAIKQAEDYVADQLTYLMAIKQAEDYVAVQLTYLMAEEEEDED